MVRLRWMLFSVVMVLITVPLANAIITAKMGDNGTAAFSMVVIDFMIGVFFGITGGAAAKSEEEANDK